MNAAVPGGMENQFKEIAMFTIHSTKFAGILGAVALAFAFGAAMAFDWSDQTAVAKWSSPYLYLEGTDLLDAVQAGSRASAPAHTSAASREQPRNFVSGRFAAPHMETTMLLDAIARASAESNSGGRAAGSVASSPIMDAYNSFDFNPYAAPHMESTALVDLYGTGQRRMRTGGGMNADPAS